MVCLLLMVRNESKIIARCLAAALPVCSACVVVDTGSTDDTVEVAQRRPLQIWVALHRAKLANGGTLGTTAPKASNDCKDFLQGLGWDLTKTYALVLDADLCFRGALPD